MYIKPILTGNKLWHACGRYDESEMERNSGVHVVAMTNSLFETADESRLLISEIPSV